MAQVAEHVLGKDEVTGSIPVTAFGRLTNAARLGKIYFVVMPVWRNWQTRWTQNPVSVEDVSVRPRSPVSKFIVKLLKPRFDGVFVL